MDLSEEKAPAHLLEWYANVLTRRVDLVGDYAGNELFLIEGDSLLLHCLSTSKVDLGDGFQILHAIYAVENFVHGLVRRKCNFHIVFFDNHGILGHLRDFPVSSEPKYLLTRDILVRHLQLNLHNRQSNLQIRVFPSIKSQTFTQYLANTGVYFLMCHDGASTFVGSDGDCTNHDLSNTDEIEGDNLHSKLAPEIASPTQSRSKIRFRYMIYEFIRLGYNVALVNELELKDTKVITTVIEGKGKPLSSLSDPFPSERRQEDSEFSIALEALDRLKTQPRVTERDLLTVLSLSELLRKNRSGSRPLQASAFLLHTVILRIYPLPARTFDQEPLKRENHEFLLQFAQEARRLLQTTTYMQTLETNPLTCDIADLLDGRLFYAVANALNQGLNVAMVDPILSSEYERLSAMVENACSTELPLPSLLHLPPSTTVIREFSREAVGTSQTFRPPSVMPFRNSVFDRHLAPIRLTTDLPPVQDSVSTSSKVFKEISHWHNSKKPLGYKPQVAKLGFFAQKRNQRFMAEMMVYAASLTNAVGKSLEPEIVVPSSTKNRHKDQRKPGNKEANDPAKETASTQNSRNKRGAHNAGKAAALAAAATLQAGKAVAKGTQSLAAWRSRCKELEQEVDPVLRHAKTRKDLIGLKTSEKAVVGAEIELFAVNALIQIWIRYCQEGKREMGLGVAALILDHIVQLTKATGLTTPIISKIELTVKILRFPRTLISTQHSSDRPLSFSFILDKHAREDLSIPMDPIEFQLRHCGPYLDRSMDSMPDDRVPFEPDGWQRKVLDAIDAKKSLFVVAPTSSGKTFISFYAMKQILQSGNDDVLVYVAPTKALVGQIAAEVQARFSKSFNQPGRSVWAIHTRDHRVNQPTGCQILVTVPHILQIMLLAPSNAERHNSWSCKVKRIIFDEVHCIGQAEDGIVWEQLLLLAPCPIIALSATVGNPEEFNQWLRSSQNAIGIDLVMVTHQHRYSDLRKFVYFPPQKFCFKGLKQRTQLSPGLDVNPSSTTAFAFIHPVASLIHRSRAMPDDLSLESRDCFTLWQSMYKHQTSDFKLDSSLLPSKALPAIVRKRDVILWEAELKNVLKQWMADSSSPFEAVRRDLQATVDATERLEIYVAGEASDDDRKSALALDERDLCSTTLPMLSDLHSRDALPGILFNYDRSMCERICKSVLEQLKAAEASWKKSSPRWANKIAEYERWKKEQSSGKVKKVPAKVKSKKKGDDDDDKISKADRVQEAASRESSIWASFNPEAPTEGFHFADYKKLAAAELEECEKQLRDEEQPDWLIEALARGVAVHHAGMNRRYRQIVEIFFRMGFLRVVIATGTLALGINAPCKTVVFSGDSIFLTALNYRQCAGRAGRRGFDSLGNVVFQGLPLDKVYRLLSSRLPDLNGHFPISTTLVLRLFTLLHDSNDSDFSIKAINSLLSQPRLYLGGAESKLTVLHHLRFSIEYLRRQYLLDTAGAPLNFAGCVSHLYFTENSSFAFHALLKEGYFHELCADIDRNPKKVLDTMMLVLAHLFGRFPCRLAGREWIDQLVKHSPSLVFLPRLPEKAEAVLRQHNDETLSIFKTYVQTYIDQHITDPDRVLPLTGLKCGGDGPLPFRPDNDPLKALPPATLRSAFVALSGHDDRFSSISELCRTVRSGVFLEEAAIPHIAIAPDETDGPLNAYLYDFFRHGNVQALKTANGVRSGDVWFRLNDFSLVLATIVTSLTNFVRPAGNDEAGGGMLEIQGAGDAHESARAERGLEDVVGELENKGGEDGEGEQERGKEDADGGNAAPAWEGQGGQGLLMVLKAFEMLKSEFDAKFRVMWA